MAKSKKRKTNKVENKQLMPEKNIFTSIEVFLNSWKGTLLFILISGIILSYFYAPMAFEGKKPAGVDVLAGLGKTHQINEWNKNNEDRALWNPYVFGGMPLYHRIGSLVFSLDSLFSKLGKLIDLHFLLFIFGALGIFYLLKYLKINSLWAFILGLIFILWPHFHALILVGHFMKFRALMYIPWVILSFIYLLNKPSILSMSFFGLLFTVQMRTQHYQIIFYGLILMFFIGLFKLIEYLQQKEFKSIYKIFSFLIIAVVLTLFSIGQPTFVMKEYADHSTRGGNSIKLNVIETSAEKKGVGIDYAVGWSLAPSEILDLVVPRFHGGSSVPQLSKGRKLRNIYWGQMLFTQSYEYFGIILLFLALFGLFSNWKKSMFARAMLVTLILALLLSFGKHFIFFYKLFFNYVPYFDKFRVPMMIVTLIFFIVLVGAGYGIEALGNVSKSKEKRKLLYAVLGFTGFILLIAIIIYSGADFLSPREKAQGPNQTLQAYQTIRAEITQKGLINTFFFFISMLIVAFLLIKEKIKKETALIIILFLQLIDILPMDIRYFLDNGKFKEVETLKQNAFKPGIIENTLLKDKSQYRVLPYGRLLQNNDWSYYFQSVGGYSPAKLQTIQNVIENNLTNPNGTPRMNWNILDILNVKYVFIQQAVTHPLLNFIVNDNSKNIYVYEYENMQSRIFPVGVVKSKLSQRDIVKSINRQDFNADSIAYISEEFSAKIELPDSFTYKIDKYTPNEITGKIYSSVNTFVKFSEMYYPNWKLEIDDNDVQVYQTDHLIRGALLPLGEHQFKMYFDNSSFYRAVNLSRAGLWSYYLIIIIGLFLNYKSKILSYILKK